MKGIELYVIILFIIILICVLLKDVLFEKFSPIFSQQKSATEILANVMLNRGYSANPVDTYVQNSQSDTLDRYYNPMRYPNQSPEDYYPNTVLPSQVIGCGGRNYPCSGGSQVPVIATSNMLDFSNQNIAPVNIRTRGPEGMPQQVGTIFKLRSAHGEVLPLFGRKEYPGSYNNWEYYTIAGNHDVKLKIVQKRKGEQLGTNDMVFIRGYGRDPYRVTMYDYDFPKYIPF